MEIQIFIIKVIRKLYRIISLRNEKCTIQYKEYVNIYDQKANDFIRELLRKGKPIMISKFGTTELSALEQYRSLIQYKYSLFDIWEYIICRRSFLWWREGYNGLCRNSGFFPNDEKLIPRFYDLYIKTIQHVDVLGSYMFSEKYFNEYLKNAVRVNLDGYYAPFFFKDPWTVVLEGKRVLVIHPFSEEIEAQYKRKNLIWSNPEILPDFTLLTYKTVQSLQFNRTEYNTWFDALEKMEKDISTIDFDIAIIGCGAYGMPLAAYIKDMGKQAIHLAGWVQILFGIIGKRWEDLPEVNKFFNEYWIHPYSTSIPQNAKKVENGCYW